MTTSVFVTVPARINVANQLLSDEIARLRCLPRARLADPRVWSSQTAVWRFPTRRSLNGVAIPKVARAAAPEIHRHHTVYSRAAGEVGMDAAQSSDPALGDHSGGDQRGFNRWRDDSGALPTGIYGPVR